MRWSLFFTFIFFLCHRGRIIAAPTAGLEQREANAIAVLNDRDDQSASMTNTASGQTTATTSTDSPTTATTSSTTELSASNSQQATSDATSVPSIDTPNPSGGTSSQNSTKPRYTGGLPVQPTLTPALGVGGFILLVSGATLAFIGIRQPWVYIHLSTAFLAALGVTVLIVYVMNPPVSNAVQGGYLVAIFFTGVIFGGLALVFKEITEGLCCLLGGFCIGMWLMTVKSGGLLTENGPKVGFIVAFAAGFYCLSFSHYTRAYGSILCTSISGATALVLGIDCFSRAGLKEFWLYIWGLNADIFPLDTSTYPVTRNIRVELAVIIIVAVFGVIAQLRLWKVIKERRMEEENSRKEAVRRKEGDEAEVGRQLEEKNLQERALWENMYGHDADAKELSMSETAVAEESRRGSDGFTSSGREQGNSFEMRDMTSPDQSVAISEPGKHLEIVEEVVHDSDLETLGGPTRQLEDAQTQNEIEHPDVEYSRPATPASHRVLRIQTNLHDDDDSEHGAVVGSEVGTPRSKRFSSRSLMKRLSWRNGHGVQGVSSQSRSDEALIVHEDATSSVLGLVDDLQSTSSDRPSIAPNGLQNNGNKAQENHIDTKNAPEKNTLTEVTESGLNSQANRAVEPSTTEADTPNMAVHDDNEEDHNIVHESTTMEDTPHISPSDHAQSQPEKVEILEEQEEQSQQASQTSPSPEKEPNSTLVPETADDTHDENPGLEKKPALANETVRSSYEEEISIPEIGPDDESASQSKATEKVVKMKLDASTVQNIPEQTSRIVNSFRTREWAKHLADAEAPDVEPIQVEKELQEDTIDSEESAAPVDIEGLLQTPHNAQQPPAVTSPVALEQIPASPEHTRRRSYASEAPRSKTRTSMHNISAMISPPPLSRNVSSASLSPQELYEPTAQVRNSTSPPFLTITGPRDRESKEAADSPRWSGPPPLLAVRENMVRNRMSSTSLRYDPWTSRNQSRQSLADPAPIVSPTFSVPEEKDEDAMLTPPDDQDDVPLSKRRAMLQRQTMQSPSASSFQSLEPTRSPPIPPADSRRSAAVMAAWRQSVREDLSQRQDPLALNSPPLGSTSPERPPKLWGSMQQMRDASTAKVDNAVADGMQRGSMTGLHRQAMRRMQASANKKL
ncbi:uncharacterized protein N7459_008291 [Penicillium hispanicum]|uniref:uncharacterized protein n=1 Tax=Penicillium hispanicum TaxID=1080232 RepID=UPI00254121C8|nr:uncharacterized protein N7459_008291 [Penicillium hispanicum]KAJ5573864.1 hypothetical protein N7459_008291 [Penicillium hispanicum]